MSHRLSVADGRARRVVWVTVCPRGGRWRRAGDEYLEGAVRVIRACEPLLAPDELLIVKLTFSTMAIDKQLLHLFTFRFNRRHCLLC